MKSVFVISSGCIYEGGGVDAVFLRQDLADAKFWELVEEKRESNRAMEAYEKEQAASGKHRWGKEGKWLEEKIETNETKAWKENCIIFQSDFISLREYQCEE